MGRASQLAGRLTISHMFAEQEFQGNSPSFADLFVIGSDAHPSRCGNGTRRKHASRGILHQAQHAGGKMVQFLIHAHGRDMDSCSFGGFHHGSPLGNLHTLIIYLKFDHVCWVLQKTSMAFSGHAGRQASQRIHTPVSMTCFSCGVKGIAFTGHTWAQRVHPIHFSFT